MELKVIKETKTEFIFEIEGVGHTFCNLLKNRLYDVKGVETTSYSIDHPLIGIPRFIVITDSKIDARKAILEAIKEIKNNNSKMEKIIEKNLK